MLQQKASSQTLSAMWASLQAFLVPLDFDGVTFNMCTDHEAAYSSLTFLLIVIGLGFRVWDCSASVGKAEAGQQGVEHDGFGRVVATSPYDVSKCSSFKGRRVPSMCTWRFPQFGVLCKGPHYKKILSFWGAPVFPVWCNGMSASIHA